LQSYSNIKWGAFLDTV